MNFLAILKENGKISKMPHCFFILSFSLYLLYTTIIQNSDFKIKNNRLILYVSLDKCVIKLCSLFLEYNSRNILCFILYRALLYMIGIRIKKSNNRIVSTRMRS